MEVTLSKRRTARTGFTLVELLVVITIIAILAGMAAVGIFAAIKAARRAAIGQELAQMKMALGKYKSDCGDYPPDCFSTDLANDTTAQAKILRHIKRRFPRYQPAGWTGLCANASAAGIDLEKLTPTSAMVFFLGGIPEGGTGQPTGFSANPKNPFDTGGSRLAPYFSFKPERYKVIDGVPVYYVEYIETPNTGDEVPYVYFRARSGGYGTTPANIPYMDSSDPKNHCPSDVGTCCPYARKTTPAATAGDPPIIDEWHASKEFQIITPGLDGEFGCDLNHISYVNDQDTNIRPKEDDNLTSFAPGVLSNMTQ